MTLEVDCNIFIKKIDGEEGFVEYEGDISYSLDSREEIVGLGDKFLA